MMKSRLKLTRAEKREKLAEKTKRAPKGAKLSDQIKKVATSRKYTGRKKDQ